MLHDFIWAIRLADRNGEPLSEELRRRVGSASAFLYQLQDESEGRAPNYGANDGALVLPLNNCDFRDFRPAVQASHYAVHGTRCYPPGAWDEDLLWLFGPEALAAPVEPPARADLRAECGGYYTLRSAAGFAFVRAASFRDRPSQADMLHVDLWWRGQNIAADAGTFSYNAAGVSGKELAANELARTAYHNTVSVDGLDQMDRAGRFLWLPWLHGSTRCYLRSGGGNLAYWQGEHDGYRRLKSPVTHRRAVLRAGDECWLVIDELDGADPHDYRLHWLLTDLPFEWDGAARRLTLHTAAGAYSVWITDAMGKGDCTITRADQQSARGWRSEYYSERQPALSIDLRCRATRAGLITVFAPADHLAEINGTAIKVGSTYQRAEIELAHDPGGRLVSSVRLEGRLNERLEIDACA